MAWTVNDSRNLYGIRHWGGHFFDAGLSDLNFSNLEFGDLKLGDDFNPDDFYSDQGGQPDIEE